MATDQMTEAQWLESADPFPMLQWVWSRLSDRQGRLLVPFELGNFRVVSRYPQLISGDQLKPVKNCTKPASPSGRLALIFSVFQRADADSSLISET